MYIYMTLYLAVRHLALFYNFLPQLPLYRYHTMVYVHAIYISLNVSKLGLDCRHSIQILAIDYMHHISQLFSLVLTCNLMWSGSEISGILIGCFLKFPFPKQFFFRLRLGKRGRQKVLKQRVARKLLYYLSQNHLRYKKLSPNPSLRFGLANL